jgi:hypothetical protein
MSSQILGKVIKILPEQTGQGKNGAWKRHDFVIETTGQYPKKICFSTWGDVSSVVPNLNLGQEITVFYNPESREYNDKWYTELRAWKINTGGGTVVANDSQQDNNEQPKSLSNKDELADNEDTLPF